MDLLRAVAIIQVIAVHLGHLYVTPSGWLAALIVSHWNDGVTLFFVISGFVITRTIMLREPDIYRMSLRAFYARRIARVQPLLLASIALGAVMLAIGFIGEPFRGAQHPPFDTAFWLTLVTCTFNWLRVTAMTHTGALAEWGLHWNVMWTLAIEEQFYLLLPITLILAGSRARFLKLLGAVILICMTLHLLSLRFFMSMVYSSFSGFDGLGVGVLIGLVAPACTTALARYAMAGGLLVITEAMLTPESLLHPIQIIIGAAMFILGAQKLDHVFGRAWQAPARIGSLSYEAYLLHPLALALIAPAFRSYALGFGPALLLAVVYVVALAYTVETFFTRPANTQLRRVLLSSTNPKLALNLSG